MALASEAKADHGQRVGAERSTLTSLLARDRAPTGDASAGAREEQSSEPNGPNQRWRVESEALGRLAQDRSVMADPFGR